MFEQNLVVCPKCNHNFQNQWINGSSIIEAANHIEARKRMYCKLALNSLERLGENNEMTFAAAKKVFLDNINDLTRDVVTILGLEVE